MTALKQVKSLVGTECSHQCNWLTIKTKRRQVIYSLLL